MKPGVKVEVTAGTLAGMTIEQFQALQKNVLAEGSWETTDVLRLSGGEYLTVRPFHRDNNGFERMSIYLGIEKDGYTHS